MVNTFHNPSEGFVTGVNLYNTIGQLIRRLQLNYDLPPINQPKTLL